MHTQHVRVISRSESVSEARRDKERKKAIEKTEEDEREREREREKDKDGEAVISQLPIASDTFPRSTIGSDYTPPRCSSTRLPYESQLR